MEFLKTFVQDDLTATIACPSCRLSKKLAVARFKETKHTVRVRCGCGVRFLVLLEFRKHRRRPVNLKGTYRTLYMRNRCEGKMLITNLSEGGLMCQVSNYRELHEGCIVNFEYFHDGGIRRKNSRRAVIRHKNGMTMGCEFLEL